jgi:hypothetical protein
VSKVTESENQLQELINRGLIGNIPFLSILVAKRMHLHVLVEEIKQELVTTFILLLHLSVFKVRSASR